MTKRRRVMAALRGETVDHVPLAFWLHNFATENSAKGLAEETLRLARRFDWDYLKPQSRAQCFAEMWGLTYAPSGERTRSFTVTDAPVADAEDLARLRPADPGAGALGEQLEALRLIRAAVGPDVPIIWTIFSPMMILPMLCRGGRDQALRLARRFDWDYLKPQSRAQCFAEMWGLTYAPSGERARSFTVTRAPVADAGDLARLRPADPQAGALGEQLEALRLIRAAVGPDVPIIWTIFSPMMVLPMLCRGGRDQALGLARSAPRETEHALGVMADTLAEYARACVAAGADGLFYATNVATRSLMSADECRRWQRPWDLRVLGSVVMAPFNLLHICGSGILLEEFVDYPVTAFSWATVAGNPSLTTVHERTGRAVVGGLPAKPEIAAMTADALVARTRRALEEMSERWLLLGPDCSINPDTPEPLLAAVGEAVRAGR